MAGEAAYLDKARRYAPEVAAAARAGLKKMQARFPGARQLERQRSLPDRDLMKQAPQIAGVDLKKGRGGIGLRSRLATRTARKAAVRRMPAR